MANLKELYTALKADGAPLPETYEAFAKYMTAPGAQGVKNRQEVYDALKSDGAPLPATYSEFSRALFSPVKTSEPESSAQGQKTDTAKPAQPGTETTSREVGNSSLHSEHNTKPQWMLRAQTQELIDKARDFSKGIDLTMERNRRTVERGTQKGRDRAKAGERAARLIGTPTKVSGLTPAPATSSLSSDDNRDDKEKTFQSGQSPIPYGVKLGEDGKPVTEWLMPDGSLTTSFSEADAAEYMARGARLQHKFIRRMEENGLDPTKQADIEIQRKKDQVEEDEQRLNYRLQENESKIKELQARRAAELDEKGEWNDEEGFWSNFVRIVGGAANRSVTLKKPKFEGNRPKEEKALSTYTSENKILEDARKRLEADKLSKSYGFMGGFWNIGNNLKNVFTGVGHTLSDVDLYAGGVYELEKASKLLGIEEKLKNNEGLTDAETSLLYSSMLSQDINSNTSTPHGYTAGVITTEMVPFMLQMMLNPASGLSAALVKKVGKSGLKKIAIQKALQGMSKEAAEKYTKKELRKLALKTTGAAIAGDLAESAVLANTLQGAKTTADIMHRYQGEVVEGKNGKISFEGDHNLAKAIYKGEAAAIIENYTERLGEHFGIIGGAIGKGVKKGLRAIGGGKVIDAVSSMIGRVSANDWAKAIGRIEKRAHWNGTVGEVLEEEAGIVLNSIFTGDNTLSDLWDADQQIDIVLGVGLFGGFVSGLKTAGYPISKRRAKSQLRKSESLGSFRFGEEWNEIRESIENSEEKDLGTLIRDLIKEKCQSKEQASALVGYANAMMRARGLEISAASLRAEGLVSEEQQQIDDSFEHGESLPDSPDPTAMNDSKRLMERQRGRLASALSEDAVAEYDDDPIGALSHTVDPELRQIAVDYVNAKAAYDGMIQRVRDDIDSRVTQSDAEIDGRTNRETQMIQPATMSIDGRQVYVVSGKVAMHEDGSGVDVSASSESLIIKDATTGKGEFIDPSQLSGLGEAMVATEAKERAREQITQEFAQAAADKIDGVISAQPGEEYTIPDVEGGLQRVTVLGQSKDENGAPIDGMVDIQFFDNDIQSVSVEDLQRWVDEANDIRVAQFEEDRENLRAEGRSQSQQAEPGSETASRGSERSSLRLAQESGLDNPNRNKDLFPDTWKMPYLDFNTRAVQYVEDGKGTGVARYQDENGNDAIIVAAVDNNTYEGYFREYDEQGNPTNRWSAKFQNYSGEKATFRNMMQLAQQLLPEGHELTEHTSVSTDGLRNLANQLRHGYELQYDENGEILTTEVPINMMALDNELGIPDYRAGSAEQAIVPSDAYREVSKRLIPYMEALGLTKFNIHWEPDGTLLVDHPILRKRVEDSLSEKNSSANTQAEPVAETASQDFGAENASLRSEHHGAEAEQQGKGNGMILLDGLGQVLEGAEMLEAPDAALEEQTQDEEDSSLHSEHDDSGKRALDRIPRDETGNPMFEAVDAETAWEALLEETEGDEEIARNVIERTIITKEEELRNLNESKTGLTTKEIIAEEKEKKAIKDSIEHWKRISQISDYGAETSNERGEENDIYPVGKGKFGEIFATFRGRAKAAWQYLSSRKNGQARGVFYRPEIGEIDLIWGDAPTPYSGKGLAHIDRKHVKTLGNFASMEEAIEVIDDVVQHGNIQEEEGNTVAIEKDQYRVVVARDEAGNWVLTAFDKDTPAKEKKKRKDAATRGTAGQPLAEARAVSSDLSEAKDNIKPEEKQEGEIQNPLNVDLNPTEAQKRAGNYQKGHVTVDGMRISVENPRGSLRSGVDAVGNAWETTMTMDYGYIRGTVGKDKDHIDIFLSETPNEGKVFVVDQYNKDGSFDEHKVIYGVPDAKTAREAYLSNYSSDWAEGRRIEITEVTRDDFKAWAFDGHRKIKPFSELKRNGAVASTEGSIASGGNSSATGERAEGSDTGTNGSANKEGSSLRSNQDEEKAWREQKRKLDKRVRETAELVRDCPEAVAILEDMSPQDIWEVASLVLGYNKIVPSTEGSVRGFREVTGYKSGEMRKFVGMFAKVANGGVGIERLSEDSMQEICNEYGIGYDNGAALSAMLDVLQTCLTVGAIRGYIANNRIRQAQELYEHWRRNNEMTPEEEAEYADWEFYQEHGFTREEYEAPFAQIEAYFEDALENIGRDFDPNDFYGNIADEIAAREAQNRESNGNRQKETRAIDSRSDRGDEESPGHGSEGARPILGGSSQLLSPAQSLQPSEMEADAGRSGLHEGAGMESPLRPGVLSDNHIRQGEGTRQVINGHEISEPEALSQGTNGSALTPAKPGAETASQENASGKLTFEEWQKLDGGARLKAASARPLTLEEIEGSRADDVLKANARAYLSGKRGVVAECSYLKLWEDVRYTDRDTSTDSEGENGSQLAATDSSGRNRRGERGQDRVDTQRMGGEDGQGDVSPELLDSKNSEGSTDPDTGKGGDSVIPEQSSRMEGDSAGSNRPDGGRDDRSNGSHGRPGGGTGGRGRVRADGERTVESGRKDDAGDADSGERVDSDLKDAIDEFKSLLDDFIDAGKHDLCISIAFMSPRQLELLPRLITAGAKAGYQLLRKGITAFSEWSRRMRALIGDHLKSAGLTDAEIDEWIREMWDCEYTVDGATRTVSEWASLIGQEKLRSSVRMTIEEKRKAQQQAESVAVIKGDIDNIRETLPFLLPQQHEDVLRAERQFFDESHNDRDHAYGKGYMFTNGTGTGKTYTGLGIVKRFVKEGKGRVLILTPSQTKVNDWINDGKNLGLSLRNLDDWAKERGTTATTEAGEGAIITTYANFRQNEALLEGTFDLIVYDESHRLLENKKGVDTTGATQHYKVSNRNSNYAYQRLQSVNPVWRQYQTAVEQFQNDYNELVARVKEETGKDNLFHLRTHLLVPPFFNEQWHKGDEERFPELRRLRKEALELNQKFEKEEKPRLEKEAEEAVKKTKVVFLSATPFNTRDNIDYAEGYIFTYPKDDHTGMSPRTRFFLDNFGAAYKYRYRRLENSVSNPAAVARQEVEFSDYLQDSLQTMSGRIIDSEYDYSRDFPTVTGEYASRFNEAISTFYCNDAMREACWSVMGNYLYSSALFESMKVNQIIPRIEEHLKRGRKVVVFHRRMESSAPLGKPFELIFSKAREIAMKEKEDDKRMERLAEIEAMRRKFSDLLEWEKGIDLSMPREQLAKHFGKDNVLFFSGKESTKQKNEAVGMFNRDASGKNLIVIQEASGKEGISLHDTTGEHQRVLISLALPQSPITALQTEGRIYRIGNRSNAIFEYPLLGLDSELVLFGQTFNNQVGTTENLALGSKARNLRESFTRGLEERSGLIDPNNQGIGGKAFDASDNTEIDGFERAVLDFYSNRKINDSRTNREGIDYFPTPEPLGYMMTKWGAITEGESILEPSAGHGAIARYVPMETSLTAIEPSTSLFSKLQLKAGGVGRKFENTIFEDYNIVNKHDVVLMNPPFGTGGRMAVDHVAKAFSHLEEGGRIVAIIPRGSTDKRFDKWYNGEKGAVLTGEILLPAITFRNAGTSVMARVLIIDKITDKALGSRAESNRIDIDLSHEPFGKIEDFFEAIRDIEMPPRTIDRNARMRKKCLTAAREIRKILGEDSVRFTETGLRISSRGVWEMIEWGDREGAELEQYLHQLFKNYTKWMERAGERGRSKQVAIYGELRELAAKLSGKSVEEMELESVSHESEEAYQMSLFDEELKSHQAKMRFRTPSLFDFTDETDRTATEEEERIRREAEARADEANTHIDDFLTDAYHLMERYKSYTELDPELEDLLVERMSEELSELNETLRNHLQLYYLDEGNSEADAERMARDMASRVQAGLHLSSRIPFAAQRKDSVDGEELITAGGEAVGFDHLDMKDEAESEGGEGMHPLRKLEPGEFCHVERQFTETQEFGFTGSERIESVDDIAYIFRSLEDYSIENTFVVLVKDGRPTIVHLGMGGPTSSMVDFTAIRGALDAYGADKVYFVHNHPSGNLRPSVQDRQIHKRLREMVGDKKSGESIIIDVTSGRYSTFDETSHELSNTSPSATAQEKTLPVLRQNHAERDTEGKDIEALSVIRSSEDVSRFVSEKRLGTGKKISYLLLAQNNAVIGNLHTRYESYSEDLSGLAEEMVKMGVRHGALRVIPYGNVELSEKDLRNLNREVKRLSGESLALLDALRIDSRTGNNYRSATDSGMSFEPGAEDGVLYRFADDPGDFDAIRERAVAERGIVIPGLAEKEVEVVSLSRHGFNGARPINEAKKWAKDNLVGTHTLTDSEGKSVEYEISKRTIDKYLSASAIEKSNNLGVHLSVLKAIPEVIEASVEAEIHPDYFKGEDGERSPGNGYNPDKLIHRFYGAVSIEGMTYRVKTTINESRNPLENTVPHSYEVTEIELLPEDNSSEMEPTASGYQGRLPHGQILEPTVNPLKSGGTTWENFGAQAYASTKDGTLQAAKLLKGVEKSYDPGVKLLEASEKERLAREGEGRYSDAEVSYENDPWSKVWGESQRTKRRQKEYADRMRRAMRADVDALARQLGLTNVDIIEDSGTLSGRQARAKGWYDPNTGKITIVLGNHKTIEDIEATLLHEAVAHFGLRKLFGERFDRFLDAVYENAEDRIKEQIDLLATRNGWNRRVAVEEYLAGLAEQTDFEETERGFPGWWKKVKRLFMDFLRGCGFSPRIELSDNELRYVLWMSWRNLKEPGLYNRFLGVAEKVSKEYELGLGRYSEERTGGDFYGEPKALAHGQMAPQSLTAEPVSETASRGSETGDSSSHSERDADHSEQEGIGGLLFRDGDFTPHDNAIAADWYEKMLSRGSWQFREAMQDSMLGLHTLYEAILTEGDKGKRRDFRIEDVAGYVNAYLYENRMSSTNASEQHRYFGEYLQPLLKAIHKICGSDELERRMLTDYMMAKHGLERNKRMRLEAEAAGKRSERDFAGLCGLTGEKDWRMADQRAEELVADYEKTHDAGEVSELWSRIKAATGATLDKLWESGILSDETYQEVKGMYEYYIPLRGWDEKTSDEMYGYLTSAHGPLMGNVMQKAEGRKSKADDPIATIAKMADDAIRQGNRNIMKQRFLNFAQGHPSDLVSVNQLWLEHDDVSDQWKPVFAQLDEKMTPAEIKEELQRFEERLESLSETQPDKYKRGRDARNIPYIVKRGDLREHQVLVKRNGRTYVLTINGNPRAAQALNGLTNPNTDEMGAVGNVLKGMQYVNRQLSAFYTTRNPDFVVSNFIRDFLYSNSMVWVKESPRYAKRFHLNFGRYMLRMGKLFLRWERGTLDMSREGDRYFRDFMLHGGETGYTSVKDIEGHKRTIAAELKKEGSVGRRVWSALIGSLELLNRHAENCARFAAFVTSRELGRDLDRSIYDAKEVSVNFNKKGSGGKFVNATGQTRLGKAGAYTGELGRTLYVFWNAGLQGLTNFGRAGRRNPMKALAGASALFAFGVLMPIIARAFGGGDGDEDDKDYYYNLPEYIRRSNVCFRAGDQWITIPLPIEYRSIYGLGELAIGAISGKEHYSRGEVMRHIAGQVSQILPIDMLEGGGGVSPFIPSTVKPMTEAYVMNRRWNGLPVYKDTPWNKDDPEWQKAFSSTDPHLVEFTKWLNKTTRGNDFKKGDIDINPAKLEYLLNGTFGGMVSFPMKIEKSGETLFGSWVFDWKNVPLANRVVKQGDESTAHRKLRNEYYKLKDEAAKTKKLAKNYKNAKEGGLLEYAEELDFLLNSKEYGRYLIFDGYSSEIKDLEKELKETTDAEKKRALEEAYYGKLREMVDSIHSAER